MSKIAVILNTHNEYHKAWMGLSVTLRNAGMPFDLFVWDNGSSNERIKELIEEFKPHFYHKSKENVGNPIAYNQMLLRAKEEGYEYIQFLAPDHVMPNNWLKLIHDVYKLGGLDGFLAFQANLNQRKEVRKVGKIGEDDLYLEYCDYVFGCWFFNTRVLDIVGYINEEYKYYGKWDSDMNFRLNASGLSSYYLPVRKVTLNDPPALENMSKYREFKNKWLAHNEEVHKSELLRYAREGNYYIEPPTKLEL